MEYIKAEDFKSYLEVQSSGLYNMFSQEAIYDSGLDKETYMSIIKNYSNLVEKYKDTDECKDLLKRLGRI